MESVGNQGVGDQKQEQPRLGLMSQASPKVPLSTLGTNK